MSTRKWVLHIVRDSVRLRQGLSPPRRPDLNFLLLLTLFMSPPSPSLLLSPSLSSPHPLPHSLGGILAPFLSPSPRTRLTTSLGLRFLICNMEISFEAKPNEALTESAQFLAQQTVNVFFSLLPGSSEVQGTIQVGSQAVVCVKATGEL